MVVRYWWLVFSGWWFVGCCWGNVLLGQDMQRYSFEQPQMGTLFHLEFYAASDRLAQLAAQECFARLDSLNATFSDYDPNSELSKLQFGKQTVSQDLFVVLAKAQVVAQKTNGAFDISIGPLSKLWRRAFRQMELPAMDKIQITQSRVDYQQIQLETPNVVHLKKQNMKLDAGGIAKGYALDEMARILRKHNITAYLLDGGGDLLIGDAPPNHKGWQVKMPIALRNEEIVYQDVVAKNCAIATSGDTYKYLEWEGKRYSHLIDPRTGFGVSHRRMVSVNAPTAMEADVLASAFCIVKEENLDEIKAKFPSTKIQIIEPE
jgi:thiamine biosynthesis lipoprotein